MRGSRLYLFLLALMTAPVLAAASPALPAKPPNALTVRFIPYAAIVPSGSGSEAFLDFGVVAAKPGTGRQRAIVVRQRVAVRLDGGTTGAPVSARLLVALSEETPDCTVRLDGMPLSTLPRLIDTVHRVGTAVVHEIEVTIPPTVPAGTFLGNLQWLAESN